MPKVPRKPIPAPPGSVWSDEAARRLGIALSTLRKWRMTGHGPQGYTISRKVAYEIAVLDQYLASQRASAVQPNPECRPPEPRISHRRRTPAAA